MKIFMGADHNGYVLKAKLTDRLRKAGYDIVDAGNDHIQLDDDFPQFAEATIRDLLASDDPNSRAILICGSGQGMCMAANRFKGIRASLVWDPMEARAARNDDDSNVLCLPSRFVSEEEAAAIAEVWLSVPFAGATRFKRRLQELDRLG
jgi:ribose 5-phosphate isomerase B